MMENGEEHYIKMKATTEAEASAKVHEGYNVDYVLDILTEEQMERTKKHLRRGISAGVARL